MLLLSTISDTLTKVKDGQNSIVGCVSPYGEENTYFDMEFNCESKILKFANCGYDDEINDIYIHHNIKNSEENAKISNIWKIVSELVRRGRKTKPKGDRYEVKYNMGPSVDSGENLSSRFRNGIGWEKVKKINSIRHFSNCIIQINKLSKYWEYWDILAKYTSVILYN
mgnify:CR=1 FL=1